MSKAGKLIRALSIGLLISLPIVVLVAAAGFWFVLDKPFGEKENPVELLVRSGTFFEEVADELELKGLVSNGKYIYWRYKILSKISQVGTLQSGRYALESGSRPSELIQTLTSPSGAHRVYTTLTVPPGLSASGLAERVETAGLATKKDLMDSVSELASEYSILRNPEGLQGYLFPDTYKIETPLEDDAATSRQTAEHIVRTMADQFFLELDEIDPTWPQLTKNRLHEKVTLASIVEREYRVQEEASMISAVFNNRIADGQPLQSCATVVYVIEDTDEGSAYRNEYLRFNRRIFIRYLEIESPFNTYSVSGLPPGPISLPGRTALEAAFFPAESDARYFVVKDPVAGTHVFTREYSDHLEAREAYLNQYVVKD